MDAEGTISLDGGVWSLDGKQERRKKMSKKLNQEDEDQEENGSEAGVSAKKASRRSSFSSVAVTEAACWREMARAEALGEEVARALLAEGAGKILEEAKRANSAADTV